MSRGTQLSQLRKMLKAEVGSTLTDGVNTADDSRFNLLLANKQLELASLYDWPFLRDRKDVSMVNAQRFYPLPLLNFERPHTCQVLWNNIWRDLVYGIVETDYNLVNSLLTPPMQVDPVMKWLIAEQVTVVAPDVVATVTGTLTGPPAGTYSYAMSYITPQGESTIGGVSTVTGNGTLIFVTTPNFSEQVQGIDVSTATSKNVYRTAKNGSVLKLLANVSLAIVNYPDTTTSDTFLGVEPPELNTATMGFFEVWPIPISTQAIRFTGERLLNPLTQDTDPADLDDLLLVYHCAAEEAVQRESPNASLKLQKASQRLQFLRASYPAGDSVFIVGSGQFGNYKSRKRVLLG